MIDYIKDFDGVFSFDDISNHFKGVKSYTIFDRLYKQEKDGLLFLGNSFVYFDKLNISNETVLELKDAIEELFSTNIKIISARALYNFLALNKSNLLEKLPSINNSFSLFSLVKFLFHNSYNFRRPLFSKESLKNITKYSLIFNYASSLDYFNIKIINDYVKKMNIAGLYSYLFFIEDMSDNFVQVDRDVMVKKEKFNISEEDLSKIKESLNLCINRYKNINTESFVGYGIFPSLSIHWNKYLLVGIVRTYLSESFNVIATTTNYRSSEFIITNR